MSDSPTPSKISAKKQAPAVGIDLGTTYSAVAYLDDTGRPVTIVNSEGDLITPSVVLFDGENTVVGKEAIKAVATEASHVAECAKRDLGERIYHRVIEGRQYPPEAIQAWILNKIKLDAQRQLGPFAKVVITVPAYFDEVRRKSTQDSGYMAGLEVIDIINEPTAAAVAFGFQQGFLNAHGEAVKPQKILVYDLGGGTFDVTVMEIAGTQFNALATDGDVRLGGRDWDQRIVDLVAEEFKRQHGIDPARGCQRRRPVVARMRRRQANPFGPSQSRDHLRLSRDGGANRDHPRKIRGNHARSARPAALTTKQTLQAAGCTWKDIDRVLLVGGSTRMPMVRQMLKDLAGKDPDASVSADEAVADGAALHAGIVMARTQGNRVAFKIRNVNSHSLGVVATDSKTNRKRTAILIPRNTPLPVVARRPFKTSRDGQRSILVQIVEGESASPEDCSQLGKCVIRDLPKELPAGTPIEVNFRYAENGRLTIVVKVANTGRELQHEITRENSLTPEQLDTWRHYVLGTAAVPSGQ